MALSSQILPEDERAVVAAFGFFSGFLTYVSATIITRKAYIRIQPHAVIVIGLQSFSLFLAIFGLIIGAEILGVVQFLFKAGLLLWTLSLVPLIIVVKQALFVDRLRFKKPSRSMTLSLVSKIIRKVFSNRTWPKKSIARSLIKKFEVWRSYNRPHLFEPFQTIEDTKPHSVKEFGISCVDKCLRQATYKHDANQLYFPILLVAEKHFRPWRICNAFAAAGLKAGEGVIYFGFNQPPEIILGQIERHYARLGGNKQEKIRNFSRLIIIDCHSSWIGSEPNWLSRRLMKLPMGHSIKYSDPRDAIQLAENYKRALKSLLDAKVSSLRVVYDSISDFVEYSDPQLALQFIKHNMVWEDWNRANSLYLYVQNVPQPSSQNPVDREFLRWNSYCELSLEYDPKVQSEKMFIDGLFSERVERNIRMDSTRDYVEQTESCDP